MNLEGIYMKKNSNFLRKNFQEAMQIAVEYENLDAEIKKLKQK